MAEAVEEPAAAALANAAKDDAGDYEEDEEGEDASADTAAVAGLGGVGLHVLVVGPLEEHDDAGADEEHGPEAGVPVPETGALKVASLDEQEDDADGDEHQGAEDRAAAKAAGLVAVGLSLGAEHIALGTGLLFEHTTLILPVVSVWRAAGRTGRGVGWRIVCHGLISLPDRAGWKGRWRCRDPGGGGEGWAEDTDMERPWRCCRRRVGRWPSDRRR